MRYLHCWVLIFLVGLATCNSCSKSLDPVPSATATLVPLPDLISTLENADTRYELADAMNQVARYGPEAAEAVPSLLCFLRDSPSSSDVVIPAVNALAAIGPPAAEAVPDLIELLQDDYGPIRAQAAYALGSIGKLARCSVPALATLLWDSDSHVQMNAAGALDVIAGVDLVTEVHEPRPGRPAKLQQGWSEADRERIMSKAQQWWEETGQYLEWDVHPDYCSLD
jgi:hypothetical protein